MKPNTKEKAIISFLIHCFILTTVIFSTYSGIINGAGDGQVGGHLSGWNYFRAYTIDSNIFYGIISIFMIVANVLILLDDRDSIPQWLCKWQYSGCACLFMTFLIVVIFLTPVLGFGGQNPLALYSDEMFFYHLLNPILSCLSLIFMAPCKFTRKDNLLTMIPTILYAIVYTTMFLLGKWPDFYGFTFGGHLWLVPIDIVVALGICYLLGYLLRKWNEKAFR